MDNPLQNIKSAVLLVDGDAPDCAEVSAKAEEYFRGKGISLKLYPVRRKRLLRCDRQADLFISLLPEKSFNLRMAARRSLAPFKIGRFPMGEKVFDIIVSAPEGTEAGQVEIFALMTEIMGKIK